MGESTWLLARQRLPVVLKGNDMTMVFKYSPPGCDAATTYFAPWFIGDPQGPTLAGWEFDFTHARCTGFGTGRLVELHVQARDYTCFEGVLVKDTYSQQIWKLTGEIDDRGFFEGRWPD
jgi:hypothetical protein